MASFQNEVEIPTPNMSIISLGGGRKDKLSPGDILGTLTSSSKIEGEDIGSIDIFPTFSYFAIKTTKAETAIKWLSKNKIKGKRFKSSII